MLKANRRIAILIVLIAVLGSVYLWKYLREPPPPEPQEAGSPVAEKPAKESARYPLPAPQPQAQVTRAEAEPADEKLPPEEAVKDKTIQDALARLLAGQDLENTLVLDNFIQRFVLMIDNLPRKELPLSRLPTRPAPGAFLVTERAGTDFISPVNERRYIPYVKIAETLNPKLAVAAYAHFYPMFQQAYRSMGYSTGYFNDRLVEVIDHLLETPDIRGPVPLEHHITRYKFADPRLEALSAGQKVLVRMGSENAAKIKARLEELRKELISMTQGT